MPRFSIIVPVYNVQNYLAACVKSVAEQQGPQNAHGVAAGDGRLPHGAGDGDADEFGQDEHHGRQNADQGHVVYGEKAFSVHGRCPPGKCSPPP